MQDGYKDEWKGSYWEAIIEVADSYMFQFKAFFFFLILLLPFFIVWCGNRNHL